LIETRGYDAFGKPRTGTWTDASPPRLGTTTNTPHGFTGHEHLNLLELIHMNGRVYDYNLGRFTGVDPVIQFPLNSQSLNPYSYILNNPLSGTDPTGYAACTGSHIDSGDAGCVDGGGLQGAELTYSGSVKTSDGSNKKVSGTLRDLKKMGALDNGANKQSDSSARTNQPSQAQEIGKASDRKGNGTASDKTQNTLTHHQGESESNPARIEGAIGENRNNPMNMGASTQENGNGVYAVHDGNVRTIGWQNPQKHNGKGAGAGYRVQVEEGGGRVRIYGHMDPASIDLLINDSVAKGQRIGNYADPTNGHSSGPHVHVQLMEFSSGIRRDVDPGGTSPLGRGGGHVTTPFGVRDAMHPNAHQGTDWAY
jgi:RHS repeat-associated protein